MKVKFGGCWCTQRLPKQMKQLENEVYQAMAVIDAETGQLFNHKQLIGSPKYKKDWSYSAANEFGWLVNGVGGRIANLTHTIKFIWKGDIAKGRFKDVTYGTFVFSARPEKKEKNWTRYAVGGNWTNYDGLVAMPTADMMVAKLLFNSVVSSIETIVLCSIKYRLRAQNSWQWTFPISISWLHFQDQNTYASASMALQRRSSKSID